MKERRKEPRYNLAEFELKGELVLFPDPAVITVGFENISVSGVCISILSELSPKQEEQIIMLIKGSRSGNFIPVQLIFNSVKIPVNILNKIDSKKHGLAISGHQKLATLAEKGRLFFRALVEEAVKKGASEADFVEYLPIGAAPPRKETGLPENFKDLPGKHQFRNLIKLRYDAFNLNTSLLRSLSPFVAAYYINTYASRDSEIVKVLGENERLQKTTLIRWVHNELVEIAANKDKRTATELEDNFKQAMYSYMVKRRNVNISVTETQDLFEGKIPRQFMDVRNLFLASVCRVIESTVQKQFGLYMGDKGEELSKAQAEKDEEQMLQQMPPVELMVRFVWRKIVDLGELVPLQKEVARTWIPKDRFAAFLELGGVVVLPQPAMEEFLSSAKGSIAGNENPRDFFNEVDLYKLSEKVIEVGGNKRKDAFGLFLDTLQPAAKKEAIYEKVIKSPTWSRYYILNKPKTHFEKVFGKKAASICDIIDKNMLTATPSGEYI